MKRLLLLGLVLCASSTLLRAEAAPNDAWKKISYVLVSPSSMEQATVDRIQSWIQTNFHYQVRSVRLDSWEGETVVEQAIALAPKMTSNDLVMVVLTDRMSGEKHAEIMRDVPVGFVNVAAMQTDDSEKFLRRLERQAIRIVGFQMGLKPTPMPFCALAPYGSIEELDRMGRGIAPPAMAGYRAVLEENKIPLSPSALKFLPGAVAPHFPIPPTPVFAPPSAK